jgi:hypothetical protein
MLECLSLGFPFTGTFVVLLIVDTHMEFHLNVRFSTRIIDKKNTLTSFFFN